jgi:hypothetical protein
MPEPYYRATALLYECEPSILCFSLALMYPGVRVVFPSGDSLGKPEGNFMLGGLHSIRAVADISPDIDAIVCRCSLREGMRRDNFVCLQDHPPASS